MTISLFGRCGCGHPIGAQSQRAFAAALRDHHAYTLWKAQRAELEAATNQTQEQFDRRRGLGDYCTCRLDFFNPWCPVHMGMTGRRL